MPLRAGVDLGGTKIQSVVTDDQHAVLGQARHPTPKEAGPQGVADGIVAAIREALEGAGAEASQLEGIGIGSPGAADDEAGTVTQARNVTPDWTGSFPLASAVGEPLGGVRVRLGNDVDVATLAEARLGAGRGHASLLGVFWGTGVGGGIILNHERWVGRGAAGEFGHMDVKLNGARCTCGRNGCVEAYAGRKAMELHAQALHEKGHHPDLLQIMQRRVGNVGLVEELQPLSGRAGFHDLRKPLIDEIVVPCARTDAVQAGVAVGFVFQADQAKERVPLLVRIDQRADIAVAGLIGAAIG